MNASSPTSPRSTSPREASPKDSKSYHQGDDRRRRSGGNHSAGRHSYSDRSYDYGSRHDSYSDKSRNPTSKYSTTDTICLVQFQDPRALQHVYKVLKAHSSTISKDAKQPIKFGMAYDSRCLGETEWVGVVIRNLPQNASTSGIRNNFTKFE